VIGARVKTLFFDAKAVTSAVDQASRRVLSRFGAFVRQRARSLIRTRRAASRPGQPPSSHEGSLRRLIFFGYEPGTKNVVIGPTPFTSSPSADLLEQDHKAGGVRRIRRRRGGKTVTMTYRARPFMGPAMDAEKPKLPGMWAGAVK